ncbi:MAG: ABC transporter permease [Oscillospiraceae bacterium]|nr:ABC transporter permease [Oscillospiraceae bacterium]
MKAINKNILRDIAHSKGRFMSIMLICMIGVGFFSGVSATGNDMKLSADRLYDKQNLFDLRVLSTFGLTDDDAAAIRDVTGVSEVYTSKYSDLAVYFNDREYLTRVYSWNNDEVNKIILHEGRFPEAENECIVSGNRLQSGFEVGGTVSVADLTDADEFPLKHKEYTIVGTFDSPMYISMTQHGSTTIGDGALDSFMYVTESNFTQEVYTEIYIKSDKLTSMESYSDEYEQLREDISAKLEELGIDRSEIRYDEVVGDALEELADGEKELEEAKTDGAKELADAAADIADAEKQIAEGEQELIDAKAELDDGAKQLADAEKELADAKTEIENGKIDLIAAKNELIIAERELQDARLDIINGELELNQAKQLLDDSKAQLDEGQAEIDKNLAELTNGKEQLAAAKLQIEQAEQEYNAGYAQYEQGMNQLAEAQKQLEQAILVYGEDNPIVIQLQVEAKTASQTLEQTKLALDAAYAQIEAGKAEIAQNEIALAEGEAQLEEAQKQIDDGRVQYEQGISDWEKGYAEFTEGQQAYLEGYEQYLDGLEQYNDGLAQIQDAERQYNEGKATLDEKRLEYEDGVKQYEDGLKEIEDAKKELAEGKKDYEEGLLTFNTEIADAEREIADAKQKIADAGEAEWYIFTRDDNPGYSEYASNAERIDKIASVFPIFFLLVAGLVCLTTMSRMVEENRTQIGTLKALGYSNSRVMAHYMTYALSAAAIGSVVGAFGGMVLFPGVIIYAYSIMYIVTEAVYVFNPVYIVLSAGSMLAAIALTVFFSCSKVLAETPASLMRPKAPKAGKRVLLERISFIWNRLSFFAKVSGRNLFRYKRRMFMTVIGIAGCTALMLTGFGLKNSVSDIIDLQYGDIYHYSGMVAVADDMTEDETKALYDELLEYDQATVYSPVLLKQYTLSYGDTNVQSYIAVAEDSTVLEQMIDFRERISKDKLSLSNGTICTEKLATLLGVRAGDEITIRISDQESRTVTIGAITEHYASHYFYMTEELYTELFGELPEYNMVYFNNRLAEDPESEETFSENIMACDGVLTVMLNTTSAGTFEDMLGMIDMVIIVLIVSAGALAFVVLYNLTNVNITERVREIATLKVLGFYDREVSSYVFRENIILSLIGNAVGLLLGIVLCNFVVQTAEIDEVMFGREIHGTSYIYAFALTFVFSLLVNLLMTRVLKKISMVESLKSVE